MARRTDHSRTELEALILDASWNIISNEGFESLTARRIAKQVGYAPGTIYNLFGSMDGLYLKINMRILDLLYEILNAPAHQNPKKTPQENMISMAIVYMEFAKDYRAYWQMLFQMQAPESRKSDANYQQKVMKLFEPLNKLLSPLFATKDPKQQHVACHTLWAAIHGLCYLQETDKIPLVDQDEKAAHKMAAFLINAFIRGLES